MSYSTVAGHRPMALDHVRNRAYADALAEIITPESVVLDIGAGSGIHGLIAAKLGARRVYLVEPEDIIAVAEEIVRANGLQDVVQCIQGTVDSVTLPEQVDVIVSALTGNFLFAEDLLPVLFDARDKFLRPGGVMLPSAAAMEIVPVSAPAIHEREIAGWSNVSFDMGRLKPAPTADLDLSPARRYAANTVYFRREDLEQATDLAAPVTLYEMDLTSGRYGPLKASARVEIAKSGLCHGWSGWFRMQLGKTWLSTSPRAERVHWVPVFLPLDPPIDVHAGDTLQIDLMRPPHGDWTWKTTTPATTQRSSTLFSAPLKADSLARATLDYQPAISERGRAVAFVLGQFDQGSSVAAIADELQREFPEHYGDREKAVTFVQSVARQYA